MGEAEVMRLVPMDDDEQSRDSLPLLLEQWTPAVRRVAASYVAGEGREDLTQDILLAVWESLPRFREESSLRTFIYRIAHNRAIDFVRKQTRRPTAEPAAEEADQLVSEAPSTEQIAEARRKKRRLVAAVRTLPVNFRQPLTMALDGLSYAEIADILDLSESNIGVRIHRARQRLNDILESQEQS
jgi:RNA polymerase sigma-70 factor (ECF subfamily)